MKFSTLSAFGLALSTSMASAMDCPSSAAFVHASCSIEASLNADCNTVMAEVQARIDGQYSAWHDPHNNGTYALDASTTNTLTLHRLTGDKKYTDKLQMTFTDSSGSCSVASCSVSQVTSVADFSTNYCNSYSLLCGSADGCKFAKTDLKYAENKVSPSIGASHDKTACLKV